MGRETFFGFLKKYDVKLYGISFLSVIKIVFIVWVSVGIVWVLLYALRAILTIFYS